MTTQSRLAKWASSLSGVRKEYAQDYLACWFDGGFTPGEEFYDGLGSKWARRIRTKIQTIARRDR